MLGVNDGSWEEELERDRDRSFSRVCFLKMKQLWRVGVLQMLLCCKLEPYLETVFYWTALQAVWRARAERFSHKTATQTLWWCGRSSAHGTSTSKLMKGSTSGLHKYKICQQSSTNHEVLTCQLFLNLSQLIQPSVHLARLYLVSAHPILLH